MTARHRTKISDFVIIQTVPPYIIPIRRGAAVYSKKRGGGSIMKDKNTEKYNAAHKPEIRFGGTDDAGLGSAERGRHIVYPDIREESRRSAVISPRAVTPVHTVDGEKEMLRCGRGGSRTAPRYGKAQDMSENSLYPRGAAHSSYGNVRAVHGDANAMHSCGGAHSSHAQSSTHPSRAADRQGGGRRGTCARIAAPICAAVCALSLIHFSFSSGDIRPNAGLSSDYIPAAITFTPPEKLEPKGFWDYFSEAMAEFFGFYER